MNRRAHRRLGHVLASAAATVMAGGVIAGVGGGSLGGAVASAAAKGASSAAATKGASCDVSALAKHKGTVTIDFWESMVTANGTTLTALTKQFNSEQTKVRVTLVQQKSYTTTWVKYQAGLSNGQLPDLVQLTSTDLQGIADSQSETPVATCIKASKYKTSDFIPRVLSAYQIAGKQIGMPFAVSGPVLLYNEKAFAADGITSAPKTLTQFVADAKILKAHGSGVGLKLDPWHLETWLASANQLFVNNGNGRKSRATKAVFDSAVAKKIWTDLDDMVQSGEATTNPATGSAGFDNLLGIGSGKYAMTIDTTAVLGTVEAVLASGQYPTVQLGVAPFPVYSAKTKGGIEVGGSALYISNKKSPLDQAAAWDYIQFLDSTTSQAAWAKGTGYIPIRKSSAATTIVKTLWASEPGYKVAYEQLLAGINTDAASGAVLGPYTQVRIDELNAEESMFQSHVAPATALKNAAKQIDQVISSYNQRIGAK